MQNQKYHVMYRKIIFCLTGLLTGMIVAAQSPDFYPPTVPEKVNMDPFNIILYIILPIGVLAAFLWYQRSQKKKRGKKNEKMTKDADNTKNKQHTKKDMN
jgi:hypothetical protein